MNMTKAFGDLRFIIGVFLVVIGLIVLGCYAVATGEVAEGIHVNLLGGGLLTVTGVAMILSALFGGDA